MRMSKFLDKRKAYKSKISQELGLNLNIFMKIVLELLMYKSLEEVSRSIYRSY